MSQYKCEISDIRVNTYLESTIPVTKQSTSVLDGVEATGAEGIQLFQRLVNRTTAFFSAP